MGFNSLEVNQKLISLQDDITALDVSGIKLKKESILIILRLIQKDSLNYLNLESTVFPASKLGKALVSKYFSSSALVHLNISQNYYSPKDTILLSNALFQTNVSCIETNHFYLNAKSDLKEVNTNEYEIFCDKLLPEDCAMFVAVSKSMSSIKLLNHSIGKVGCKMLGRLLKSKSCCLHTLNLSSSSIGIKGSVLLSESLHTNHTLTVLNLSNVTSISQIGISALTKAFEDGPRISKFQFYFHNWNTGQCHSPSNESHCNLYLAALLRGGCLIRSPKSLRIFSSFLCESTKTQDLLNKILFEFKDGPTLLCFHGHHHQKKWNNRGSTEEKSGGGGGGFCGGGGGAVLTKSIIPWKKTLKKILEKSKVLILHTSIEGFSNCFKNHCFYELQSNIQQFLVEHLPLPVELIQIIIHFSKIRRKVIEE